LTPTGNKAATHLIRKHRLWEVFLVNKLRFAWHQVHEIAEELEHIDSEELISRLDAFLDYPKFDPHGDPIPNADGRFTLRNQINLSDMSVTQTGIVLGVKESETEFLKHLTKINIKLGSEITILGKTDFDQSLRISIDTKYEEVISQKVSQSILMKRK
jgi:DtxR family Mn-dependent transcriptional regulator